MHYKQMLKISSLEVQNCACMGLDVKWDVLPNRSGNIYDDVVSFVDDLFNAMVTHHLSPSAFKPNIGYYHSLDNPHDGLFDGSRALSTIFEMVHTLFPSIPIIFDSKRGDIATSSANYAQEAFDVWKSDCVTVSPYMGSDSVLPFLEGMHEQKGIYVLNRTSNPGGKDLQQLMVLDNVDEQEMYPFYMAVSHKIGHWAKKNGNIGAVVGATHLEELREIAQYFAPLEVPLLIPGVGSQGASAKMTLDTLKKVNYPLYLARINSSSSLTHPWKQSPAPSNWLDMCITNIEKLLEETHL